MLRQHQAQHWTNQLACTSLNLLSLLTSSDDLRGTSNLLSEDVSLDKPGQPDGQLVVNVLAGWDREDLFDSR